MKQITHFVFFTYFLFGLSLSITAQTPNWAWAKCSISDNPYYEKSSAFASDNNGNIFVAGTYVGTVSFGNFTLTSAAVYGNFLVKYDLNGNVIWAKSLASGGKIKSLRIDKFQHLYLAGDFSEATITFDNITIQNNPPTTPPWGSLYQFGDIFVAQYDLDGNAIWAKSFGGEYHDNVYDIAIDGLGNICLTGSYSSWNIDFGAYTLHNNSIVNAMEDIFIAKLDSNGNALWAKGASGNEGLDIALDIQTDTNGNVFVAGLYENTQIHFDTTMLQGTGNAFLLKYDANGNVLWGKSLDGLSAINNLTTDNIGNAIITGRFSDSLIHFGNTSLHNSHYLPNSYNSDVFTVKYGTNGNPIWAKGAGSHGSDEGLTIQTDSIGNIYVGGQGNGGNMDFGSLSQNIGSDGRAGMFIVKYDLNGDEIWTAGNGDSVMTDMIIDPFSNLYVLGDFRDTAIFGTTILLNDGNNNHTAIFLAKMGNIVALPENIIESTSFQAFPNPFSSEINFIFEKYQENSSIIITDIQGKTIKNFVFSGKELHISKLEMVAGIYFVCVKNYRQEIIGTKKIIYTN